METYAYQVPRLRCEDLKRYILPLPEGISEEGALRLTRFRRQVVEHRVRKVNELYDAMKEVWPDGTALDFFVALEKGNGVEEETIKQLQEPEFVRQVIQESEKRGMRQRIEPLAPEPVAMINDLDSETESEEDDDEAGSRRSVKRWSPHEVEHFKNVIKEAAKKDSQALGSWKDIAKRFPGRTVDQCQNLYHRLRASKELEVVFRQRKSNQTLGRPTARMREERERSNCLRKHVRHVVGIHFVYRKMDSWVGPSSEKLRAIASSNPVANYIDQITAQKIVYPAISPDGYLLDYTTWLRLLKKEPVNPFTTLHMNKRQLVFLTYENIDEFKDQIVNLVLSRPLNPEDDALRDYWDARLNESEQEM